MVFRCSGGDTFTIASTSTAVTTLNTGAGADTINVQTIDAATAVNAGADVDTVNVGSLEPAVGGTVNARSEEHTSELQSHSDTLYRLLLGDNIVNTGTLASTTLTHRGLDS